MINVVWLSLREETPPRGYWDMALLEEFFEGCEHHTEIGKLTEAIVVIPGAYQAPLIKEINAELAKLKKCLVIVTSDEENNFPLDKLKHPNMRLYANYANPKYKNIYRWLPIGAPRKLRYELPKKTTGWFFSGQVNHEAREKYVEQLEHTNDGQLLTTAGFAQGLEPDEYYDIMLTSKVVPAPRGNISPDSFRAYEALELGAVPVPQDKEFWDMLFDNAPFPIIDHYEQLSGYIEDAINDYPAINNRCMNFWVGYKYLVKQEILEYFEKDERITVLIPTSWIPSHPSTKIIEQTVESVRHHLPDSPIIIQVDGLRDELKKYQPEYDEYIRRLLWLCNHKWGNVLPILFTENMHQVAMGRAALEQTHTPYVLYMEHDTPLVTDLDIDFEGMKRVVDSGEINFVRLHFESRIPDEHKHLMLDDEPQDIEGVPIIRTCQYSQRPHLATTAFYRHITRDYFSENAKTFYEDYLHGKAYEDYVIEGIHGWRNWRIGIYAPKGNYKRSLHTDGREGYEKYDKDLVF